MNKLSITLLLMLVIYPACFSKSLASKEGPNCDQKIAKQDSKSAELALREYLLERSLGRYEKCLEFLSAAFQNKFLQKFGTTYVDYYLNQNEDYYKNHRILTVKKLDNGLILISVTVEVVGPGYKSEALESYYMIQETSGWKIHDWKIEYKK